MIIPHRIHGNLACCPTDLPYKSTMNVGKNIQQEAKRRGRREHFGHWGS